MSAYVPVYTFYNRPLKAPGASWPFERVRVTRRVCPATVLFLHLVHRPSTQVREGENRYEIAWHYQIPYPRLHHSPKQFKYKEPPIIEFGRQDSHPSK
mgnify:CR=1 FL=1